MSDKPGGYGRYKDDPNHVGCPRAKSDMTPCVARDGRTACDDSGECVGCGASASALLIALQDALGQERTFVEARLDAADPLRDLVREATEPK
jgi:hypothetical protein